MIAQIDNALIALLEIGLAFLIMHRAMPTVKVNAGVLLALEIYLIALVLAMFGVGRMLQFLNGLTAHWIFSAGHYCLIAYGILRYHTSMRSGARKWWDSPNGEQS